MGRIFSTKKGRYKTVEALMLGSKRKSFTTETSYKKYEETQNSRYNRSLTRLIVLTNQETNETIGFTMTIMPSVEYMEQTDFKSFIILISNAIRISMDTSFIMI